MLTTPQPPAAPRQAGNPAPATASAPARHDAASPAEPRHRLGSHLRALLQQRALRLQDVAASLGIAPCTLSRIEPGDAPTRASYLTGMLDLYGIDNPAERALLTDLARQGQGKPWWANIGAILPEGACTYLDLEATATTISIHATHAIPGIAQTRAYALKAARLTRPDLANTETGLLAYTQADRRQRLRPGCQLHLIIDQAALLKSVAPADVLTAQLRHLLALGAQPGVTVQFTSLHTTPAVLSPSFTVLTFADAPAVTCCQGPAGQAIITRRAADATTAQHTFQAIAKTAHTPEDSASFINYLTDLAV